MEAERLARERRLIAAEHSIRRRTAAECSRELGLRRRECSAAALRFRTLKRQLSTVRERERDPRSAAENAAQLAAALLRVGSELARSGKLGDAARARWEDAVRAQAAAEKKHAKISDLIREHKERVSMKEEECVREELSGLRAAERLPGTPGESRAALPPALPPVAGPQSPAAASEPAAAAPGKPEQRGAGGLEVRRHLQEGLNDFLSVSYCTTRGAVIELEISSRAGRQLRVALIPELLRHRLLLNGERQRLAEELRRAGLHVADIVVYGGAPAARAC